MNECGIRVRDPNANLLPTPPPPPRHQQISITADQYYGTSVLRHISIQPISITAELIGYAKQELGMVHYTICGG